MATIKDFYTRENANEGIKVPLFLPSGEESEHYLVVAGHDSDRFREKETEIIRRFAKKIASEGEDFKSDDAYDQNDQLELLASLILDWSFDEELTEESAIEMLREAPQIAQQVNALSTKRELFIKKKS